MGLVLLGRRKAGGAQAGLTAEEIARGDYIESGPDGRTFVHRGDQPPIFIARDPRTFPPMVDWAAFDSYSGALRAARTESELIAIEQRFNADSDLTPAQKQNLEVVVSICRNALSAVPPYVDDFRADPNFNPTL